jgi:energy-converting hydrogenase Eha subunit A
LVSFAGYAFGLYDKGLTIQQWLICVLYLSIQAGFGAISLIVNFIIKLLPIAQEKPIEADAKVMP